MRALGFFFLIQFFPLINCLTAQEQIFQRFHAPVEINGKALSNPFGGGLNAPQFSEADLNKDGIADLVVFDRAGDVLQTYLNEGKAGVSSYVFAPDYACYFPTLVDYMQMRDYDKDGAADIFCASTAAGSQEIQVFKGYYEGNILKFKPFRFSYPGCPSCDRNLIWYPDKDQPGFWNNLFISKADIPEITDVDNDGDLDIVTFAAAIGGHVWYLRNTSVESGFGRDSLKFVLEDECWGDFYESGFIACNNCLSPVNGLCCNGFADAAPDTEEKRHPGSTVMLYDKDGDGDKEVVLGDISFGCLNMMTNGGTPADAWMVQQDTAFPSNSVPVNMAIFPAAFYLDLNNDGKKDMVVAPNSRNISEDRKGVWFYPNKGTVNNHRFELETRSFLVGDMIDIGTVAHPAFADINADGLMDLVIGNYGYYTAANPNNASLYLYLNVGTESQPRFALESADWLGMTEFSPNDFDFTPAFGDLDGDGDQDLLVGSNLGALFCYFNTAGAGQPMKFERSFTTNWLQMDVGQSSSPAIFDADGDGLNDILLGERRGNVNFFKNIGLPGDPKFNLTPTVENWGGVTAQVSGALVGYSTPAVLPAENGFQVITGTDAGLLRQYEGKTTSTTGFTLASDTWGGIDEGERTHPAFADLDSDGILEMAVGNRRGGLSLYKTVLKDCSITSVAGVPAALPLRLSPNPARAFVNVEAPFQHTVQWRVINVLGQLIATGNAPNGQFTLPVRDWTSGLYWIEVLENNRRAVGKFLKNSE